MTRTYTAKPVWTWRCDRCGREHALARSQSGPSGLPTIEQMRARGWFIAESFGDLCPPCFTTDRTIRSEHVLSGQDSGECEHGDHEACDGTTPGYECLCSCHTDRTIGGRDE